MRTEQADSGRGPVPRLRDPRTTQRARAVPVIWLNLVCLDAPLVAIAWLGVFARTFHVRIQPGNAVALFLTAWLIYLGDRLADSLLLRPGMPRSLRQDFCLRHREIWTAILVLVAGFDAYVVWRATAAETFFVGAVVGLLALIYLVLNHPFGRVWRTLPAKELVIGFLFAVGTLVALLPNLPRTQPAFVISAAMFAIVCSLNCISIAGWERELDEAQGKVSIATRYPAAMRSAAKICGVVGLLCFAIAIAGRAALPILACLGLSAIALAWLNASRFEVDTKTALADLILLTPLVGLILLR